MDGSMRLSESIGSAIENTFVTSYKETYVASFLIHPSMHPRQELRVHYSYR
jgi:hypothetical protein